MTRTDGWRRRAAGQTLAIFALMLPVLIGMAGLGADGGNVYLHYRNAQSAADLAALGGARILPMVPTATDYTTAENRAVSVAASNGYNSGVTAIAPYVDSAGVTYPNHVEVLIDSTVPTYFLPLFGRPTWTLDVRAVAGSSWVNSGGSVPAVYAGCGADDDPGNCPDEDKAIDWSGNDSEVIGGTISNCTIKVGGNDNEFDGGTTYLATPDCDFDESGSNNNYNPAENGGTTFVPWPITLNYSDFNCDVTINGKIELKNYYDPPSSKTIEPGVYCATGSSAEIVLGESDVTGNVTLVSQGKIDISGSNVNLTSYTNNVMMWAGGSGSPTIKIAGSGSNSSQCLSFQGIIYAREGQIELSGGYICSDGGGSILGDRVKMNGNGHYINSLDLNSGGVPTLDSLKLYE